MRCTIGLDQILRELYQVNIYILQKKKKKKKKKNRIGFDGVSIVEVPSGGVKKWTMCLVARFFSVSKHK